MVSPLGVPAFNKFRPLVCPAGVYRFIEHASEFSALSSSDALAPAGAHPWVGQHHCADIDREVAPKTTIAMKAYAKPANHGTRLTLGNRDQDARPAPGWRIPDRNGCCRLAKRPKIPVHHKRKGHATVSAARVAISVGM
jgi:hypothetical protein